MPRGALWTLLFVTITLVFVPGTAVAQEETAWEALVRENPSVAEEGVTPRLERQILQRLTPEQADRFAAGEDPSTILLADGRDLGTALTEVSSGPGGVYVPVDSCKLTGTGVPGGNLYPDGDTLITVRGTCGIPPEAIGLVVNLKVPSPTEAGRVSLFPAGGGQFGSGFLNFRMGSGFNNAVVVELCEGTCASGDLVVRMVNISAPQAVVLHAMGYFAPEGDADPTNELNTSVELVGTTLEVTDSGGTRSADLESLVDDADADPANELLASMALVGTTLEVADAGGVQAADLGSLVDDADADPANELNASMSVVGTQLQVTDAGGTLSAELGGLVNDADSDPTNELNTSVALVGTELHVTDAGGTRTAALGSLVDDADADPANEINTGVNLVGTELQVTDAGGTLGADLGGFATDGELLAHAGDVSNPHLVNLEQLTPTTAKGDLLVEDGADVVALPVGSDGQVLTADSAASAGVKWTAATTSGNPDPPCFDNSTRFVDCGNGTVTDTVTGLIWLLNWDCVGSHTWDRANRRAAALADGWCGLTDGSRAGDWRLPTREEWEAMLDPGCPMAPKIVGNGVSGGCYEDNPWASGVLSSYYWSSTTVSGDTSKAWGAFLLGGFMIDSPKEFNPKIWPVRGGQ